MTQVQTSASLLHFDPTDITSMPIHVPMTERPRPLQSVTASATRLTSKSISRHNFVSSIETWQEDAWEMFDLVGEQRFLSTTIANRLSQARFYVGRVSKDNQEDSPRDAEDVRANEVLESIGNGPNGLAQMIKRLGINMFITGDGWFVGVPPELLEEDQGPRSVRDANVYMQDLEWRMLSISEVTFQQDGKVDLKLGPNGEQVSTSVDDVYLIRIWNEHPRRAWEADSPTRSSLPVLRELVGLTMHVSSQVDSRLAGAGLMLVPQSAQRALKESAGIQDGDEDDADVFADSLMEAMMTPISDRSSASAVVPLVLTVPDDSIEHFRHISFDSPLDSEARELRDEAIRRLALGQDAPPELLLGTDSMNHWGAWLVREDVVTTHLEPQLALIADALTTQFLRPVLQELGYTKEESDELLIWYKVDHMTARPNRGTDAQTLYDKGVLSDKTLRQANGFDENDAPQPDDEEERGSLQIREQAITVASELIHGAPTLARNPGLLQLVKDLESLYSGEDEPESLQGVEDAIEDSAQQGGTDEDYTPVDPGTPPNSEGIDADLEDESK